MTDEQRTLETVVAEVDRLLTVVRRGDHRLDFLAFLLEQVREEAHAIMIGAGHDMPASDQQPNGRVAPLHQLDKPDLSGGG